MEDVKEEILFKLQGNAYIRRFVEDDFKQIQSIYEQEGWSTIITRADDGLNAWKNSNLSLVVVKEWPENTDKMDEIIGVVRGFTDEAITTYIIELLVHMEYRGLGVGGALLEACHKLYPKTRIEVLATELSKEFYSTNGFREIYGFRKSYI